MIQSQRQAPLRAYSLRRVWYNPGVKLQVPDLDAVIAAFCRKWHVRELAVFGSVLREDFSPTSDVDVMVELAPDHTWSLYDWIDMRDELAQMFGRKVDLVSKKGLKNPIRRREILATSRVLYAA